jgi:hypothetical protein
MDQSGRRQPVNALSQQLPHRVVHKDLLPPVPKALGQRLRQAQVDVHLAQQQDSAIAGERAAGKIGHDLARTQVLKQHRLVGTVCHRRSGEWCFHLA